MPAQNVPNLLLIGAPKCGTTSLAETMAEWPSVFIPAVKETYYWSNQSYLVTAGPSVKEYYRYRAKDLKTYLRRYFGGAGESKIRCDASTDTMYFHANSIPRVLNELGNGIHIIALIRRPDQAMISRYVHNVKRDWEKLSLEDAIKAWPGRKAAGWSFDFDYVGQFDYAEQLAAFAKIFDNLLVIDSEDFFSTPEETALNIATFLNIPLPAVINSPHRDPADSTHSILHWLPHSQTAKAFLRQALGQKLFISLRNLYRKKFSIRIAENFDRDDVLRKAKIPDTIINDLMKSYASVIQTSLQKQNIGTGAA